MRAVDTSVLIRLMVRDDPEQVDGAERFVAPGAWISLLVLMETVWVLKSVYGLSRRQIGIIVGMLAEHDRITLQHEVGAEGARGLRAPSIGRILRLPHRRDGPQGGAHSGRYVRQSHVTNRRCATTLTTISGSSGAAIASASAGAAGPSTRCRAGCAPARITWRW